VSLPTKILIGLLVGGGGGLTANLWAPPAADGGVNPVVEWVAHNLAEPIGQIFLRLLFMVALPLVFCALVLGVAELGDLRRLGRMGLRMLALTVLLSGISVAIGVGLTNTLRPGAHLSPEKRTELRDRYGTRSDWAGANAAKGKSARDALLDIIPKNPLQEAVGALDGSAPGGGMLAVMFFALVIGAALAVTKERTAPLVKVLEGAYDVVMVIIRFAMRLAPFGVAGLMFSLTAVMGLDVLRVLGWYVVTVLAGLLLQMFGVYTIVLRFLAHTNPLHFFGRIGEAMMTALATSSSNATLPTSLRVTQDNLGVRREVAGFVLTVGSTANQNGTALFEGVTVLFLAQVFGVHLGVTEQITVVLMCILAGIGTAGIPAGSLPLVALLLQTVGIPAEGIGIILGVDRLLDMCRTAVNVTGDIAIAVCVNQGEEASPTRTSSL